MPKIRQKRQRDWPQEGGNCGGKWQKAIIYGQISAEFCSRHACEVDLIDRLQADLEQYPDHDYGQHGPGSCPPDPERAAAAPGNFNTLFEPLLSRPATRRPPTPAGLPEKPARLWHVRSTSVKGSGPYERR